jgi:hypothetical protein
VELIIAGLFVFSALIIVGIVVVLRIDKVSPKAAVRARRRERLRAETAGERYLRAQEELLAQGKIDREDLI